MIRKPMIRKPMIRGDGPHAVRNARQWLALLLEKRRLFRSLWYLATVGVVVGSLLPDREFQIATGFLPYLNDKVQHFGAYSTLALLAVLGQDRVKAGIGRALCMILLGIVLEFGQMFSPGRTPDAADALANTLGVFCGIALALGLIFGVNRNSRV
jgi:VanZ like family